MFVDRGARICSPTAALQLVLAHEPEVVLPALSFEGGDRMLAESVRPFAPAFAASSRRTVRHARGGVVHAGPARVPPPRPRPALR